MATISSDFPSPPDDPSADPGYDGTNDPGNGYSGGDPTVGDPGAPDAAVAGSDGTNTTRHTGIDGLPSPVTPPDATPTPYDFMAQAQAGNPGAALSTPANLGGGNTNGPGISGLPSPAATATADPNAHLNTRLGDQTGGGLPSPGHSGGNSTLGPYANDPWAQAFFKNEGYFDPRYNTADSIIQELQRGGNANLAQAERMRGMNGSLDAIVDAIKGRPDYFNSANAAGWDAAHNNQISGRLAGGEYQGNLAAQHTLANQAVQPGAHPVDDAHALMTQGMEQSLVGSLTALGVDPTTIKRGFDSYGNATIDYLSKSGTPEQIKSSLVGLAGALETLRQRVGASQQPQGGGGGYGPRGGFAPRGGDGAPYDTGMAANAALAVGNGLTNGPQGGSPASAQPASAFGLSIMPGGYSPYDEPQAVGYYGSGPYGGTIPPPTPAAPITYGDTNVMPLPGSMALPGADNGVVSPGAGAGSWAGQPPLEDTYVEGAGRALAGGARAAGQFGGYLRDRFNEARAATAPR